MVSKKSIWLLDEPLSSLDKEGISLLKELINEHNKLKDQLETLKEKNSKHKIDQLKFNEKIDELNQETDILLDEIDKWQM